MGRSRQNRKQRTALFKKQGGKCFYCQGDMLFVHKPAPNFKPPNMCTLEHLDHRLSPERGKHGGEYRRVAACHACNHQKGIEATAALPIEELRRRCQHVGDPT